MMIEFNCACGQSLQVGDDLAGKKARCPFCYKVLNVPAPESVPATAPPATLPAEAGAGKPATAGKPSREKRPSADWRIAVVVIVLAIVAGILLWRNLSTAPGPSPGVPEKQVAVKVVPPALPPSRPPQAGGTPKKAIPPKPPAEKPGKAPVPVKPPTPAPSPAPPPAGKVTIKPAPRETAFQPGQPISGEIGESVRAIVVGQVQPHVNLSRVTLAQPVQKGIALKATVGKTEYEGVTFRPFNAYVAKDGTVSVRTFYVKTTAPWKLDNGVTIPADVPLQFENSRYMVTPSATPPVPPQGGSKPAPPPPARPAPAPAPEIPPELQPEAPR